MSGRSPLLRAGGVRGVASNILRLLDHVMAEWDVLPAEEWLALWGAVEVRIRRDILPRYDDSELAAARAVLAAGNEAMYLPAEEGHTWPD